jgi:hypothetical protein
MLSKVGNVEASVGEFLLSEAESAVRAAVVRRWSEGSADGSAHAASNAAVAIAAMKTNGQANVLLRG